MTENEVRTPDAKGSSKEKMIRVDGPGQVLALLRSADPQFRETLLKGIEKRDAALARKLRSSI